MPALALHPTFALRLSQRSVLPGRRLILDVRGKRSRLTAAAQQEGGEPGRPQADPHQPPAGEGADLPSPPSPEKPQGRQQPAQDQQQPELQLPREVITRLRETVFSFNTFFVTSVENYEANGVIFKGNLRGDPATTYAKLSSNLREELGDAYKLFLLEDRESKPVAVVLPAEAAQVQVAPAAEAALAVLFAATTVLTTMNINAAGDLFNLALLTINPDPSVAASTLPGTAALLAVLAAHELGHIWAARRRGVQLGPPLLIPAGLGLLGSFGAITRIKSPVPNRETLAAVAVAGPLAGAVLSFGLLLAGLGATLAGSGGIEVDALSFRDSLLVGALGQAFLGDQLFAAESVNMSPLFVAGWAGLIIQSINVLPLGELDGGRLALGLWGRRAAGRLSTVGLLFLGLAGFVNSLPLFWLLAVLTLQRGPIQPCDNELSEPASGQLKAACIAALLLPLLILLPYPFVPGAGGGIADVPPVAF